jgi:hypothetical protein
MAKVKGVTTDHGPTDPRGGRSKSQKDLPEPVYLVQNTGMNRAERRSKGIRGPGLSSNRPYRRRS